MDQQALELQQFISMLIALDFKPLMMQISC